ncbi:MAG: hypothetical protein WC522_02385 [Candidatus Omnitrophota bacterium]
MKKYNIRKNWADSFNTIARNPVVLLPFIVIAFLETLSLEIIFFSARWPFSIIAGPIIKKFFGEAFLHYPANLITLPGLFYFAQTAIYILIGIALTATSVNIFKNIKAHLPVKRDAILKNTVKTYPSLAAYALVMVIVTTLLQKIDMFIFAKALHITTKILPQIPQQVYSISLTIFILLTTVIIQALLILTVPVIVIEKTRLVKAIFKSVRLGFRNFAVIFNLIFLPLAAYLPIILLKSFSAELAGKTFPEITLCTTLLGVIVTVFLDCFVIICVSKWLLDHQPSTKAQG